MDQGWVKLHRQLLDKPIWHQSTPEQKAILITLLLMANHEEKEWEWQGQKFKVLPGQFVTSLEGIQKCAGMGISEQNVRTALARFEKLEFLTNKSTKRGRLITIVNWELYQSNDNVANKEANKDLTKTSQRPNKDLTPNKNDKNERMKEVFVHVHGDAESSASPPSEEAQQDNPPKREKTPRKDSNPDVKVFLNYYRDTFLSRFGERPVVDWGKDGAIVKRLLSTYGLEKLKGLLDDFFKVEDDDLVRKNGYTLGMFKAKINGLIAGAKKPEKTRSRMYDDLSAKIASLGAN